MKNRAVIQGDEGVRLSEVIPYALAARSNQGNAEESITGIRNAAAPLAWTAEDHSRLVSKVREELARRREQAQVGVNTPNPVPAITKASSDQSPATLFDGIVDSMSSQSPDCSVRIPCPASRIGGLYRTDVRELVAKAYTSLSRCVPEDHVLADPQVNSEFVARCKLLGADVSELLLNHTLLNNRKAKRHAAVLRVPVSRLAAETFEQIRHAVEIAASLVQREWFAVGKVVPSVDDILCNPDLRRVLGVYVSALHDHINPIDCHLALLAFRKSGREASTRCADLSLPQRTLFASFKSLDPDDIPAGGGVYQVLCKRRPVFVSSAASLRARLREHLERGGEAFLPESLPFQIDGPLSVEVFHLPKESPRCEYDVLTRRLRLKQSGDQVPAPPDLNWRESGALFCAKECVVRRFARVG